MQRYHSTNVINPTKKNVNSKLAKVNNSKKKKDKTIEIEVNDVELETHHELVDQEIFSPSTNSNFTFKPKFYKPTQMNGNNHSVSSMITMRNISNSTPELIKMG